MGSITSIHEGRIPVPHFPCRPSVGGGDMAACEGGGREGLSSWRGSTRCHQGLCLHLTQAQAGWPVCHPDQHPTDARTKARPRRAGAGSLRGGPAPCSGNSGHHTLHLDKLLLSFQGSARMPPPPGRLPSSRLQRGPPCTGPLCLFCRGPGSRESRVELIVKPNANYFFK